MTTDNLKATRKVVKNTLVNVSLTLFSSLINLFLLPFIVVSIGAEKYGVLAYVTIFSMAGYGAMLEMGLQTSVTKFTAEYLAKGKIEKINLIFNSLFIILLLMGAFVGIAGFFSSHLIVNNLLKVPSEFKLKSLWMFKILFATFVIQVPSFLFLGFLEGLQRYDIVKGVRAFILLANAICAILIIKLSHGFELIAVAQILLASVEGLILLYFCKRVFPQIRINPKYFNKGSLRQIYEMAKMLGLTKFSSILLNHSDKLILGMLIGPKAVTSYEILVKFPRFFKGIIALGSSALLPAISSISANEKQNPGKSFYIPGLRINFVFALLITSCFFYYSPLLLKAWAGADYVFLTDWFRVLLVWSLCSFYVGFSGQVLIGVNKEITNITILAYVAAITKVTLMLFFVKLNPMGTVAITTLVSLLVVIIPYIFIAKRNFDFHIWDFLKNCIPGFTAVILPILFSFFLGWLPENMLGVLARAIAWGLLFIPSIYLIFLNPQEKLNLKRLFNRSTSA